MYTSNSYETTIIHVTITIAYFLRGPKVKPEVGIIYWEFGKLTSHHSSVTLLQTDMTTFRYLSEHCVNYFSGKEITSTYRETEN